MNEKIINKMFDEMRWNIKYIKRATYIKQK